MTDAVLPAAQERMAVLAMALTAFAMNLNASVLAPLNPFFEGFYGWSKADLGVLLASASLAGAAGSLVMGPFVDRFGRRPALLVGLLAFAAASAGHCFTTDYDTLLTLRVIAGAAAGVSYSSASAVVADIVPYQRRGASMGLLTAGMFLAVPLGLPLAQQFAVAGVWQATFAVQAGLGFLAFVSVLRTIPAGLGKGGWVGPQRVFRGPEGGSVLAALLAVAAYVGMFSATVQYVGTHLHDSEMLEKRSQALVWVVLGLSSAVGAVVLSRFADRIGKRNFVMVTTMAAALCVAATTQVDGSLALFAATTIPLAIITAARTGPFQALISELVPADTRGTLMGIRSAFMQAGIGGGALLAGFLMEEQGFESLLYATVAGMIVSWALIRSFVREPRTLPEAP